MAVAPEREEEPVPRPIFDLTVSLRITGNEFACGVVAGIGIAVLFQRNPELVKFAVKSALEVIKGLQVGNIAPGSITVELLCRTRESFLSFMEDFEAKKVKQRLNEEFRKIGHNEELEVTITNDREVYKKLEEIRHSIQGFGATEKRDLAIPLCLPNNWKWDPQTGKCIKVQNRRSTLYVNEEALTQLRKIKGPVCVVSIAGTYRMGKSFVLSEAFNQPDVFPLGHEMEAKTVGIWLWIVPEKKEVNGREFTVVLLNSEGIDSAANEGFEDHQIFTLTVLLASVLMFNSKLIPTRSDLKQLEFIAKLSQRIQILSNSGSAVQKDESELYQKTFPYFIWLLRDVTLSIPSDCKDLRDYFFKKVFKEPDASHTNHESKSVAEGIVRFFSGFQPFTLPPPTDKPEIMANLKKFKQQTNPLFWSGLEEFKDRVLEPILTPKHSVNDGELVTGEALAALVPLYVKAINTSGAIPNVQNAWDKFVKEKFCGAKQAALVTYDALLTAQLSGVLPCDNDTIRVNHNAALEQCEEQFMAEVNGFSTKIVEFHLKDVKVATKERLTSWLTENETKTKQDCKDLLGKLKKRHLDPVLQQLKSKSGAKQLSYADIVDGYKNIEKEYKNSAKGAKDVIAAVFLDFHPELMEEKKQNLSLLRQLKDFNEEMDQVLAARAAIDMQRKSLEEQHARLQQQFVEQKKQMELLIKNQEEEKKRVHEYWEEQMKKQKGQLENMLETNMKKAQDERKAFIAKYGEMRNREMEMQQVNKDNLTRIKNLSDRVSNREKETEKAYRDLEKFRDEMKVKMDEAEKKSAESRQTEMEELKKTSMKMIKAFSDRAADKEKEAEEALEELRKLRNEMTANNAANPPDTGYGTLITDRIGDADDLVQATGEIDNNRVKVEQPGFFDFLISLMPTAAGAAVTAVAAPFVSPLVAEATAIASKCSIM